MKLNSINRIRKQLWLLPFLLLSMGVVQAQEPVTLEVSSLVKTDFADFLDDDDFKVPYGVFGDAEKTAEFIADAKAKIEGSTGGMNKFDQMVSKKLSFFLGDSKAELKKIQIVYKDDKTAFDLFMLDLEEDKKYVAGESVSLVLDTDNFWNVIATFTANNFPDITDGSGDDGVEYVFAPRGGSEKVDFPVTPKDLYIAPKVNANTITYGEIFTKIELAFDGFAFDDDEEDLNGNAGWPLTIDYINTADGAAPFTYNDSGQITSGVNYTYDIVDGAHLLSAELPGNYEFIFVDTYTAEDLSASTDLKPGTLEVLPAVIEIMLPEKSRKYDDPNIATIKIADLIGDLVYGETFSALLADAGFEGDDISVTTDAKDGDLHATTKSDVGAYDYSIVGDDKLAITETLTNYKITYPVGSYNVMKDLIYITVRLFDYQIEGAYVMQKIYGEANPVGYFSLKKREESAESTGRTYSFAQAAEDYLTASTEAKSGFLTAPVFGLKDDDGNLIDPFDETTPVKLGGEDGKTAVPYVATVSKMPTSTNYEFEIKKDGSFLINKRQMAFRGLNVYRDYGHEDKDTLWTLERTKNNRGLTAFDDEKYNVNEGKPIQVRDQDLKDLLTSPPSFVHSSKTADKTLNAGSHSDVVDFWIDLYDHFTKSWDQNYELSFKTLFQMEEEIAHYKYMAVNVAKIPLEISFERIVVPYGKKIANFNLFKNQSFIKYDGFVLNQSGESLDVNDANNRIKDLAFFNESLGMTLDEAGEYFNQTLAVGIYELTGLLDINKTSTNYDITIVEANMVLEVVKSEAYVIEWNPVTDLHLTVQREQHVWLLNDGVRVDPTYDFKFSSSDPESVEIVRQKTSDFYLIVHKVPMGGKVDITVSYEDNNMIIEPVTKTFTVNRALNDIDVTITIGKSEFIYDGNPHSADVTGKATKEDEEYIFSITYDGEPEIPVAAGTYGYQIYAIKVAGTESAPEFSNPVLVRRERIVILPIDIVVEAKDQTIQYGDEVAPGEWTITEGAFLGDDYFPQGNAPVVAVKEEVNGIGQYTLEVTGGVMNSNYNIIRRNGVLTIGKKALTITAENAKIAYGDELPALTLKYAGLVAGETADNLNYVYEAQVSSAYVGNVGEYTINVVSTGDIEPNYVVTKATGVLTVEQADPELQWAMDTYNVEIGDVVTLVLTSKNTATAIVVADNGVQMNAELDELTSGYTLKGMSRGIVDLTASQVGSTNFKAATKVQRFTIIDAISGVDAVESGKVSVYPTLVENTITLQSEERVNSVYVVDLTGKVQKSIQAPESQIDLSTLNRGHHVVVINLEGGSTEMVRILKK